VRKNLEREVKFRVLARNKAAAMDALAAAADPRPAKALVEGETERLVQGAREDLKQRGVKDADKAPIPAEIFTPQAERRVRLGLVVAELVRQQPAGQAGAAPGAHRRDVAELREAGGGATLVPVGRSRMAEVEAIVVENNVTDFVLGKPRSPRRRCRSIN